MDQPASRSHCVERFCLLHTTFKDNLGVRTPTCVSGRLFTQGVWPLVKFSVTRVGLINDRVTQGLTGRPQDVSIKRPRCHRALVSSLQVCTRRVQLNPRGVSLTACSFTTLTDFRQLYFVPNLQFGCTNSDEFQHISHVCSFLIFF